MKPFEYVRPSTQQKVIATISTAGTKIIAGGTNLVDLMKRGVMQPDKIVDINDLPLRDIKVTGDTLTIGALALNGTVAENELVLKNQPLLALALHAGASAQLRNMATVGGNMMQRTRCPYFYDTVLPCNKRNPGSGCGALKGFNRMHAIFGTSDQCIAVHPSDMCVALVALDASVNVAGKNGTRRIRFEEFHRLPGNQPQIDNNLAKDELITSIDIPSNKFSDNVYYLKVRDRQSFAFALISVAAALQLDNGTIRDARLAMGGVAHKPWRLHQAEKSLIGKAATEENFKQAAAIAMQGAKTFGHNDFKLKLAPNSIIQALKKAAHLA